MSERPGPRAAAAALVAQRFPDARAAWLGGSTVRGGSTATSDLDVTVLLPGPPAPYRESLHHDGWPVELFVHDERSLRHYRAEDVARRRPTMQRLVGESVVLVDADGSGERLALDALAELAAGPPVLTADELASARYLLTDLLEDLLGAHDRGRDDDVLVLAGLLLQHAGSLALTSRRRWTGGGKWLLRELRQLDDEEGSDLCVELVDGVRAAVDGSVEPLVGAVDAVLAHVGGRLFDGHRLAGTPG